MLRSIRDICGRDVNFADVDEWYERRDQMKTFRAKGDLSYEPQIADLQRRINESLFMPEYITVVVDHPSHYNYMCDKGVTVNGRVFRRFSCSAGQARNSTVVFVDDKVAPELRRRINNGRDMAMPMAASKFNAYFGLASSGTHVVSEPRFVVVKDYENQTSFMANYVTETGWDEDDLLDQREITLDMNRNDGMGLISPAQSQKWADELGMDFLPSQWIVRQSFLKGMLCTFDFHQFCEEVNGGNYIIDTIYTDESGNPIKADLRDYDVIISESQFKLWDSYKNTDEYIAHYHANGLKWGVTQRPQRYAKDVLKLNYQFIQTLRLNQTDIEVLCEQFVDWIQGVSYENPWYMLLFLLGVNNTEEKIAEFMRSSDAYWIKSLIANPAVRNDRFIRQKIHDLVKKRIDAGCMGEIYVDGNFQMMVSDPYAMMQAVCGLPVTGLLQAGETYSNYWNERGVRLVDAMRSPLTYRSEHILLNLRDDAEVRKWYRYCETGIIFNYHEHHVVNAAGADFDGDIIATTNNPVIIRGVYRDEYPVVYDPPKPVKKLLTDADLQEADRFSFGGIIGSITNKGSNAYALQPNLEDRYGADSEEVALIVSRLRQCCKAQAGQIDKTKIGQEVKGIPDAWVRFQRITEDDSPEEVRRKEFANRTLINRPPYFFRYRYRDNKRNYDVYRRQKITDCANRFGADLDDVLERADKTPEEQVFVDNYYEYMPCTWSDSPMNLLCRHLESVKFNISQRVRAQDFDDGYLLYKNPSHPCPEERKEQIVSTLRSWLKTAAMRVPNSAHGVMLRDGCICPPLDAELGKITSDRYEIVNALVDYYYVESPNSSKKLLWEVYGKYLFNNVCLNTAEKPLFPMPCPDGEVLYMGKRYTVEEVDIA